MFIIYLSAHSYVDKVNCNCLTIGDYFYHRYTCPKKYRDNLSTNTYF